MFKSWSSHNYRNSTFFMANTKRTRSSNTGETDAPTFTTHERQNEKHNENENQIEVMAPKKRGRKPRGSKIIESLYNQEAINTVLPNVIIQFHCKLDDVVNGIMSDVLDADNTTIQDRKLDYSRYAEIEASSGVIYDNANQPQVQPQQRVVNDNVSSNKLSKQPTLKDDVIPSDTLKGSDLGFTYVDEKSDILLDVKEEEMDNWEHKETKDNNTDVMKIPNENNHTNNIVTAQLDMEINDKIREMEVNFHNNNTNGKRSSCFWDTCSFDTSPFYLLKETSPYGCFCSLNCALSYLEHEDIDSSSKFERRQLLFKHYSSVVGNKSFVKPAPEPRYTLDKYYGNLNIQQWRSLLASDRMLLIVDKPLTPELPQLHMETTDRFLTMGYSNTTDVAQYGKFKIRKVAPKQSKCAIVAEKFGVVSSR